ncbi:TonB-dependent receptor [Mariniflexile litorale]|uniref:TonB-dependent receptor n=1 Tax=Mariniflexile litorale TaxID=3045158 RepID=A0AAU7EBG8_9FLAO|nr:TonB-dependent receptor [Mariniflexile sp. KMM 9835]MDQ8212510.1 TonB-dependent receptor [Mariniflexile sp. KMM 9835]
MNIKLFLIPFAIALSAYSQDNQNTVSGKVLDSLEQPLFGVTVSVDNNSQATITDENGVYTLNNIPAGKHLVKTSYMGFASKSKEISFNKNATNKKLTLNFSLIEKLEALQQVNLQGKTEKRKIEEKGFAVNVIETKEASLRNIQTNELLNTTVGVKIRQNGGLGSNVQYSLNGLSGSAVRIFIDGIPITMYGSSFSLNSIPPSMIKNIEVYKGVIPGHLADDALGGAINVVLHKGTKTNFNASVSYGSFNTTQTNLNGLYRFENSGFTVKASAFVNYSDNDYKVWGNKVKHIEIDGSQTPIVAKRFYDAYKSTGGMAQVGFTDVKWADQFLIGFTGSEDYKEIQHGAFMTLHPYKGRFSETDAKLSNLTYIKKGLFTKGLDINITGLYGKRNTVVNDTVAAAYTWAGEKLLRKEFHEDGTFSIIEDKYTWGSQQEGGPSLTTTQRNVASLRSGVSYAINRHHKILINHMYSGLDREDSDKMKSLLENTFKQTSDLYKNIYSLSYELNAFEDKFKFNVFGKNYHQKVLNTKPVFNDDRTAVINEVYKSDKDYNGYGFATSYAILPNITILTSAEKAVRLPSESEVFGDVAGNIESNLTVKPEISNNFNLGFRFGKYNIQKHEFTISTNLFSRNIKDLIGLPTNADRIVESGDELIKYANFDEGTTSKGIDAEINYSYNNNFGFNFNFSRLSLKSKNRAGMIVDIPNTPLFTMNAGLRYSIKNFIQKNARLNLFSSTYFTDEFSYIMSQGTHNSGLDAFKVPMQLIQDFGLSYTFPKENFVLSFDTKNIFNEAAYDNRSVQKPGRAFYLKLNYTINKF